MKIYFITKKENTKKNSGKITKTKTPRPKKKTLPPGGKTPKVKVDTTSPQASQSSQ